MAEKRVEMASVVVDADAMSAGFNPMRMPSAPMADAEYVVLETDEERMRELVLDNATEHQARMESYATSAAVKSANEAHNYHLDADEEAVILSKNPSKFKAKEIGRKISSENQNHHDEVLEYNPSDTKYGESSIDHVDHQPTDYSIPKPQHDQEYQFGSDGYKPSEYKFES